MDTGFRKHGLVGVVGAGIVVVFLVNSGFYWLNSGILGFLFLISSILPDIDSPNSRPRKMLRGLLLAGLASLAGIAQSYISPVCTSQGQCGWVPLILGSGIFVLLALIQMLIPRHRGILHSPLAVVVWGVGIGLVGGWVVGVVAAAGYTTHLLVDFIGDRV